ncbi:MAG: cyclase [Gammaproteobacteria bacterium]|nr:cyclase [Gammaproteobacteria bacterium]|tara:strand:- start:2873 stop:3877 length:1005 start_codon:yes stop_codon:yes gene_type:complete
MKNISIFILLSLFSLESFALSDPKPMSDKEFNVMLEEISNWGRWGKDDQLGTLNTITPTKKIEASRLVQSGRTVSLELELNKVQDIVNQKPFEHEVFVFGGEESFEGMELGSTQAAGDVFKIDYHGFGHSHLDGINHFAVHGKMYNGYSFEPNVPNGFSKLGIENIGKEGIFTRGVLVDFPKFFGKEFLEPGQAITTEDLEAWEKASGVKVTSGDVLLVRTGRWKQVELEGIWNFIENASGFHASVAAWLKDRDVAAIGCDGVSDVMPSGVEGKLNPLHELVLVGLGMPIFDNLDLEALSEAASEENRNTFLFVAAPMRVKGATGSPLNPIAVF